MAELPAAGAAKSPLTGAIAGVRHDSPYAGSWYPGDAAELNNLLDSLWAKSQRRTGPCLAPPALGFVVPHAGLMYSGTVAAAAYRHLEQERPARLIVLGFSHHGNPPGLWIPEVDGYTTPLGETAVDRDGLEFLLGCRVFRKSPEARLCDHSVEIQLPLVQRAAPGVQVVPVYVGQLDADARSQAAERLAQCAGPGTVFLASSDFTHFGSSFGYRPFPVDTRTPDRLRELDFEAIDAAGSLREDLFLRALGETSATVCGYHPVSLLLATLRLLNRDQEIFQQTLDYQTSGEITGDFHHSVSYAALGYFPWSSFELGPAEQAQLLDLARTTLLEYQRSGRRHKLDNAAPALAALERRSAVFVSVHCQGELRGCLGRNATDESLWKVVAELTVSAATEDRRFAPVSSSDTDVEIEISVLSPLKRIEDLGAFLVNVHGARLQAGSRQGLLLPQVASERNWSSGQFFEALARKAGVNPGVYADPSTRVHVFRAQIIH